MHVSVFVCALATLPYNSARETGMERAVSQRWGGEGGKKYIIS